MRKRERKRKGKKDPDPLVVELKLREREGDHGRPSRYKNARLGQQRERKTQGEGLQKAERTAIFYR